MPTNVKENGFESSIVSWLVQHNGYEQGSNADYNKEIAMDETRLFRFLNTTQADKMKQLRLENDPLEKEKFLQRLDQSLHTNGVIDLLRKGFRYKHLVLDVFCNGVQREHNKKLNNGLPILHKVPPKRDYGRYFCIMAEKGGTSHGGLTEKLSPFFHAKKQEVNAYGR